MMKVLVCGSRAWSDRQSISRELSKLPKQTTIIHGAARGADRMAGEIAEELGFQVIACPADWARFGKAAGIIRNQQMLDEYSPDLVIAFIHSLENSPGTQNTIKTAKKRRIRTLVFVPDSQVGS